MSIWYPEAMPYGEYLQANSFSKDITGQIKSSSNSLEARVTEQTRELVASNEQLAREFGNGFDSVNSTLNWGINSLENVLQDVNSSIESLHASYNYSMGLLLEEVRIHNKLLNSLLDKMDAIHKTLESPTLTQAREFYRIGCERLSKGLLDKALEAFIAAEKKNDADFFTQFQIGKLYLYGIDDDDNILDLEKAKKHLRLAARFAKAEIAVDAKFSGFAAEALLHASIAIYAQLGEKNVLEDAAKTKQLLEEAKQLASEAMTLCPHLLESFFHSAKYSAMLNEPQIAIPTLETAIIGDRNYAVKVDIDHAFDPIRPHVLALLSKLKDAKRIELQDKLNQVSQLFDKVSLWHPEESIEFAPAVSKLNGDFSKAQTHYNSETYFGFLDAILLLNPLITLLPQIKSKRIEEIEALVRQSISSARSQLPLYGKYSIDVENAMQETNNLISQSINELRRGTYEAYQSALALAKSANLTSAAAHKKAGEEDEAGSRRLQEEKDAVARNKRRDQRSKEYAIKGALKGALSLGIIGGLFGCQSCISKGDYNLFSGAILGAICGAICGAIIGEIMGNKMSD